MRVRSHRLARLGALILAFVLAGAAGAAGAPPAWRAYVDAMAEHAAASRPTRGLSAARPVARAAHAPARSATPVIHTASAPTRPKAPGTSAFAGAISGRDIVTRKRARLV